MSNSAEMKSDSQILRDAADHIEKVGLNQNGQYFKGKGENFLQSPCCAMGAVAVATGAVPGQFYSTPAFSRVEIALGATLGGRLGVGLPVDVASWNDLPETTQTDVTSLLRGVADELDA